MPFANYKFPEGSVSTEQKEEIVHKTTDLFSHDVDPIPWRSSCLTLRRARHPALVVVG